MAKLSFLQITKSYFGFLTGTGKSIATIGSYKGDLSLFESFLREKELNFFHIQPRHFKTYLVWLEKQGLKTNTKRRKLITAKSLVRYAVSRKKIPASALPLFPMPDRLERLPWVPQFSDWEKILEALPADTNLQIRNRLIVLLLGETGLPVAEICRLRWDQWKDTSFAVEGKYPRSVNVSVQVQALMKKWRSLHTGKHLFPGYNRHGISSEKMTPRGVELFFRHLSKKTGYRALKPKTLRHFAVAQWIREGKSDGEVQKLLGVSKTYSLQPYKKFVEQSI